MELTHPIYANNPLSVTTTYLYLYPLPLSSLLSLPFSLYSPFHIYFIFTLHYSTFTYILYISPNSVPPSI